MWNSLSNEKFLLSKEKSELLEKTEINLNEICRTCLGYAQEENNLLNEIEFGAIIIKNKNGNNIRLIDMLISSTGLVINESENLNSEFSLPLQICNDCIQDVIGSYFFKFQCFQANESLKKFCSKFISKSIDNNTNITFSLPPETNNENVQINHNEHEKDIPFENIEIVIESNTEEINPQEYKEDNVEILNIDYGHSFNETDFDLVEVEEDYEKEEIENFTDADEITDTGDNESTNQSQPQEETLQNNSTLHTSTTKNLKSFCKNIHQCPQCDINFNKKSNLISHLRSIHPKFKAFECQTCKQKFPLYQTLKRHEKIHQADKRNKNCQYCDKSFIRTDDLKRHIRIHTNERPYLCTICQKSCKQSSELKEHLLVHTENRQYYTCPICSKTLLSRNGMYVHMKVHSNIRNHKCNKCDKEFFTSGELNSHVRHIHTQKKEYLCGVCDLYFSTIKLLKLHWNSHDSKTTAFTKKSNNTVECVIINDTTIGELSNENVTKNDELNRNEKINDNIEEERNPLEMNEKESETHLDICEDLENDITTYLVVR